MRRRVVITLLGGAAIARPLGIGAQHLRKVVGVLTVARPDNPLIRSFLRGLNDLGWIDGQNVTIELRSAPTVDRLPDLVAELVRFSVDVIFAPTSHQVEAARRATATIPIVFATHGDPVGVGHVASLAHPGGNVTGLCNLTTELTVKGLEVLRETFPRTTRIGILWHPTNPSHLRSLKSAEAAATKFGVQVHAVPARSADEFDGALSKMAQAGVAAFLLLLSPVTFHERVLLGEAALKHRLAGVFPNRENVEAGGLIGYGPDLADLFRRAATYVDKILKGAKPADLPVEQASKYELLLNLRIARALGLTIPPSILLRADEVIE